MEVSPLPRTIRRHENAADAYRDLVNRLVAQGALNARLRPLSLRNILAFFHRILTGPAPSSPKEVPWRRELMDRYRATHATHPRTSTARRAHTRWLTCLLHDRCPEEPAFRTTELTPPIVQRSLPLDNRERRHAFSVAEVQALYAAALGSPFSLLLLRLLFTTGLRIGGVCRLPIPPLEAECVHTVEKGGVVRSVHLAPCVWADIRTLWDERPPRSNQRYLFPARYDVSRPVSTSHLKRTFRRLCDTAGVRGSHAHVHTTRHTVAVALRLAGARLVDIAAFLGHANINTTYAVYSAPSHQELVRGMRLPWMAADGAVQSDPRLLEALAGPPVIPPPPDPLASEVECATHSEGECSPKRGRR